MLDATWPLLMSIPHTPVINRPGTCFVTVAGHTEDTQSCAVQYIRPYYTVAPYSPVRTFAKPEGSSASCSALVTAGTFPRESSDPRYVSHASVSFSFRTLLPSCLAPVCTPCIPTSMLNQVISLWPPSLTPLVPPVISVSQHSQLPTPCLIETMTFFP